MNSRETGLLLGMTQQLTASRHFREMTLKDLQRENTEYLNRMMSNASEAIKNDPTRALRMQNQMVNLIKKELGHEVKKFERYIPEWAW
jgi:thioesterase domain-containing protein